MRSRTSRNAFSGRCLARGSDRYSCLSVLSAAAIASSPSPDLSLLTRVFRVLYFVPRGTLELVMANLTLYLSDDLVARAKAAAAADGRSVSNWMARQLERALPILPARAFPPDHPRRQVDLEELTGAIARTVERGPRPAGSRARAK